MKARHGIHGHNAVQTMSTAGWCTRILFLGEFWVKQSNIDWRLNFSNYQHLYCGLFWWTPPNKNEGKQNFVGCAISLHILGADCILDKVIVKVFSVNDEKAKSLQRVYDVVGNFFSAVFCWKPKHDMNLKMCKCHNCFGGETNLSLHYLLAATHFAMKLSAKWCLAEPQVTSQTTVCIKGPKPAIRTPCRLLS